MSRPSALLAVLLAFQLAGCGEPPDDSALGQEARPLTSVTGFGSNPGGLRMLLHVPATAPNNAPLVVAMHGCTQSASDYQAAGWSQLADKWGFYVVYPESQSGNKCFRWYDSAHTRRGKGDALSIKQMVDYTIKHYSVDTSRVFVTGFSAGGAMTPVMLAAYPDVFRGGAVMAGIPYRCADSIGSIADCMYLGKSMSAKAWGDLVRGAYPGYSGPYPRVSIWAGTADYMVQPGNLTELMRQWTDANGIDAVADATQTVGKATREEYRDAAGQARVETWSINGMSHAVSVDPGLAVAGGCGSTGAYFTDTDICSTYKVAQFFGLGPGSSTPPASNPPASNPPASNPPASNPPASCTEVLDANYYHVVKGRAHRCGPYQVHVCANGSNDDLGLWNMIQTWVHQTKTGTYEKGRCP